MSHKIQVRRGLQSDLPLLDEGEIGFSLDQKRTYIGSPSGNVELAKASELADIAINVKTYGAKGDGVADDTAAIQAAIDTKKPVKIPQGDYRVTDTLRIYENTKIIGDYGSTNDITKAKTKVSFDTVDKKDLFVWDDSVDDTTYVYGVHIEGLAIIGTNGLNIFNLRSCADLQMKNVNSFGYFDHAVVVDYFIDSEFKNCSFQGITKSPIVVKRTIDFSTTTTFSKCYFAHSQTGIITEGDSINSLVFDDCIFESLDRVIDQHAGNNVFFYKSYVERVPKNDTSNDQAFLLGVNGSSVSAFGTFLWQGGIIQGFIGAGGAYPENATLVYADKMREVSFSDANIARFMYLMKHTANTAMLRFSNPAVANVSYYGKDLDWTRINITGGNLELVYLEGDSSPTQSQIMSSELQLMPRPLPGVSKNKVMVDEVDKRLKFVDGFGLLRKTGFLSAGSADTLFPNGRLQAGELLLNDVLVAKGFPVGFVSQKFSRDTSANNYTAVTTVGSPVITNTVAGNQFFDFQINDYVTLSAGMPSATYQYRIVDKAKDGSSITLDFEANANATGVHVQIPTHDLQPFGQMGYRTHGASPVGVFTPNMIGEELFDNVNKHWYKSVGLTAADWKRMTI